MSSADSMGRSRPISVVTIYTWGDGGRPIPTVDSAICDVCGNWADTLAVSGTSGGTGSPDMTDVRTGSPDMTDVRTSRRTVVVVYACTVHYPQVADALCDEFGYSSNSYRRDELAEKVAASDASQAQAKS